MKIEAQNLKLNDTVKIGSYGQWLKITNIQTRLQKNGKEVIILTGDTERVVQKIKGYLKPIISEAQKNITWEFKALTKIKTL